MSIRTKTYQDPRYLQLWLVFDWPTPADRVPVECTACDWSGRRARQSATVRPCPRCAGDVLGRRRGSGHGVGKVVRLAEWSRDAGSKSRAGQQGRRVRRS